MMNRGERIRVRREELGISQAELARMLGKTRSLISYIEKTGKVNDLTFYDIIRKLDLPIQSEDEQFLVKRFDRGDESQIQNERSRSELEFLRREVSTLRDMVELQKAVIELLRRDRKFS